MNSVFALLIAFGLASAAAAQNHSTHSSGTMRHSNATDEVRLKEGGQAAFAAIQEVVAQLEADPATDWPQVNVEVLRRHLVDMDNVVRLAEVRTDAIPGGARFTATGAPDIVGSIHRMAVGHATTMQGESGWRYAVDRLSNGAVMTVTSSDADAAKIRALGFVGVLARGYHHQSHHLMMATGGGHPE